MTAGDDRGISLIEVILTIVVLAVIIPGLFFAITHGTTDGVHTEVVTTAAFLAQEKMEEQIAAKKGPLGYGGFAAVPVLVTENPVTGYPGYTRILEVCYLDPGPPPVKTSPCDNGGTDTNYKIITVTVQYTNPLPYTFSDLVYETVVTNY